jgi:hypothetical protein
MNAVKKYWHWFLIGGIFFCEALVLFVLRDNIYVAVCDNLDLFIAQLKLLRDNNAFFAHGQTMEILNGIDRDYFPTEFSLYNILYLIFPDIYAYIIGYLMKLVISFASCILLAKLLLGEQYARYEKLVVLVSAAYGILPVYPMYSFCFASMPLAVYLVIRIYRCPKPWMYVAMFLYPLVSYFSFFGIFILGYILLAFVFLWIRDKKAPWRMLLGLVAMAVGFICFEYRLFGVMLLSDEATIRSTMVIADYNFKELVETFFDAFVNGVSHARTIHTYFVFPICMVYLVINNVLYILKKKEGKIYTDAFNLTILFILFNCLVYILYYAGPVRRLVQTIIPPLAGFEYGRTVFFNTMGWYFAFFIVLKHIYDKKSVAAYIVGIVAILIVGSAQCEYSDFYNTVYCNAYKLLKHSEVNQLTYREFYGGDLIEDIKEDIDYTMDDKACVYGFHPAMLSYNGISTVDGYLGYYSQEYKDSFRNAIAPTLDKNENWEKYYDNWACRAYLFSASGENTYDFGANSEAQAQEILIDEPYLKDLGCDYIFSRFELTNADDMNLGLVNIYSDNEMPYSVYLYELR